MPFRRSCKSSSPQPVEVAFFGNCRAQNPLSPSSSTFVSIVDESPTRSAVVQSAARLVVEVNKESQVWVGNRKILSSVSRSLIRPELATGVGRSAHNFFSNQSLWRC